ncbi:MAG: type III pantothenate kinase [Intestinimonas sp.]|nr:type III pantothenate kinase [Intestinimonas sp.]
MILAIDVGNSNTTLGLFDSTGRLLFRSALATDKNMPKDQCAIALMEVFHLYKADIGAVTGTILSSVVPPVTDSIYSAVKMLTGKIPMVVGPGIKTGLNIRAELHTQLGADIVADSVCAISRYPSPVIIVDMGTAITLSLLIDNSYEGCAIMPGVRVALEALSEHAAELPHISIQPPPSILGRNTIDAMRAGILYGNASMVDGMIGRFEKAAGVPVASVVATGGSASSILKFCQRTILYDANLLLDGLYLIYQKNKEAKAHR